MSHCVYEECSVCGVDVCIRGCNDSCLCDRLRETKNKLAKARQRKLDLGLEIEALIEEVGKLTDRIEKKNK